MQTVDDVKKEAINEYIKAVVEELEDLEIHFDNDYFSSTREVMIVKNEAIEIVEQGGVSDDVCEWKQDNMCETVYRVCGGCFTSAYQKDFKYCPYCGKKIKVVE